MKFKLGFVLMTALCCCCCCCADNELPQKVESLRIWHECLTQNGVEDEESRFAVLNSTNPLNAKHGIKCQWTCWLKGVGFIRNGAYDADMAVTIFRTRPDWRNMFVDYEKAIRDCKNMKGEDDCETGFKIALCFRKDKGALT